MKKQVSKYSILLVLAVMFAAPGLAAYFFYKNPAWLGASRVNKGVLLKPPVAMDVFDEKSKWRLVLISPVGCDKACLEQLHVLERVRVALGRKFYQVDQWVLLGEKASPMRSEDALLLKKQEVHVSHLSLKDGAVLASLPPGLQLFIVSPDNYFILGYQTGVNPEDIYKDLKLLLNTTETRNG